MIHLNPRETADILREIWRDSRVRELNLMDMNLSDHSEKTILIMREKRQQQALTNAIILLDELEKRS